jgi:hypothetical protein
VIGPLKHGHNTPGKPKTEALGSFDNPLLPFPPSLIGTYSEDHVHESSDTIITTLASDDARSWSCFAKSDPVLPYFSLYVASASYV